MKPYIFVLAFALFPNLGWGSSEFSIYSSRHPQADVIRLKAQVRAHELCEAQLSEVLFPANCLRWLSRAGQKNVPAGIDRLCESEASRAGLHEIQLVQSLLEDIRLSPSCIQAVQQRQADFKYMGLW